MIQIDFTADAAYVYLPGYGADHGYTVTTHQASGSVLVDFVGDRFPIGVEVIGLKSEIPIRALVNMGVPDQTIRGLLSLADASFSGSGGTQ